MPDEPKSMKTGNLADVPAECINQRQKTKLMNEEFEHTRKRLSREKVAPLLQFTVFSYNCANHTEGKNHTDYASQLANLAVVFGNSEEAGAAALRSTIAAVEHLLAALKSRVQ